MLQPVVTLISKSDSHDLHQDYKQLIMLLVFFIPPPSTKHQPLHHLTGIPYHIKHEPIDQVSIHREEL